MTSNTLGLPLTVPRPFSGKTEDWGDWSWRFKNYTESVDQNYAQLIALAERTNTRVALDDLIRRDTGEPDITILGSSRALYVLLADLVRGPAVYVLKQADSGNFVEAWRLLLEKYSLPKAFAGANRLFRILPLDSVRTT